MSGELTAHAEVGIRDDFGRFAAACDAAATRAIVKCAEEGARVSHELAPDGPPRVDYGRTPKLRSTIEAYQLDSRSAGWGAGGRQALPMEHGAGPHAIHGRPFLAFPGNKPGGTVTRSVMHPGNRAQPYLRPALEALRLVALRILRREYPGGLR